MEDLIPQSRYCLPVVRGCIIDRCLPSCKLDESLEHNCTAALVSAPPGYGKTIAVLGWLKHCALPYVWLTLDESDNDPVRFQTDFVAAMQKAAPSFGNSIPKLDGLAPYTGADWVISVLINEISQLEQKVIIVLDDLHIIKSQEIFGLLRTIIDYQADNIHLLLLTREDPPLPIARWRVRRQITELRENYLRFDIQEAGRFLQSIGVELSGNDVGILNRRSEGWAAGLYLAGLALHDMDAHQRQHFIDDFQGTQKYIIDYLVEEVLAKMENSLRLFLCQTAIVSRFNVALCNALTGRDDSCELIAQLEKNNIFIFPLDENRQWYRYHSLFGEILKSELSAGNKAALHQKAARWLEENGYPEEAITQAEAAGDHQHALQLLSKTAPRLIQDGEVKTLLNGLNALPEHLRSSDIPLSISNAWCLLLTGKTHEAADLILSLNPEQLSAVPPDSIAMLNVLLLFLQTSYNTGSFASLMHTVENLCESNDGLQAYTLHAAAQRLLIHGNIEKAAQKFIDTYFLARSSGQHYIALLSAKDAALNLLVLGRKHECDRFCRQVLNHYDTGGKGGHSLTAMMYLPMAISSYASNDLQTALNYIEEALPVYRQMSMVYLVIQAELQLSVIQHGLGYTEEALKTIADVADSLTELGFRQAVGFMKAVEADFLLAAGRKEQAVYWAESYAAEAEETINHINERQAVIYARILIAAGRYDNARGLLARLESAMAEGRRNYRLITVYLLQSIIYHRQDKTQQAAESMSKALNLAADEDMFRLFLDEGSDVLNIIKTIPLTQTEFVGKLFVMAQEKAAYNKPGEQGGGMQKPVKTAVMPECLSDRETEVLRLAADGCSNEEIARTLYITLGTVKWHMNNIFTKMGVSRRTQAIAYAKESNII